MYVDNQGWGNQQENNALRSLIEISNESEGFQRNRWKNNKPKKRCRSFHKVKSCDPELVISRSEKLPFIPKKSNIDSHPMIKSSDRVNHCLIIDKGLGAFNSVQIKRGNGHCRYLNSNSNYIRLYSESNQHEIQLIKHWLNVKKQSCKSYNSIAAKRHRSKQASINHNLSIKHIL